MDQVKQILQQAIKYRFWIVTGLSALMPLLAYFVARGSIAAETEKKAAEIKQASDGVKPFVSGDVRNSQFTGVVKEKTDLLAQDVDQSWKLLYERQAPLLDWPAAVQEYFPKWGRKWPEGVDPSEIENAKAYYVRDYPEFVDKVYATFRPFDFMEGTGVVVSPPKEQLLHPAPYDSTTITKPPSLVKIWDAQEKLWLQRTLLDVVDTVNRPARDWDGARIKQIYAISVGSLMAQDQKSRVNNEALAKSPELTAEGEVSEEAADVGGMMSGYGGGDGYDAGMGAGYAGMMMAGRGGMGMGMGVEQEELRHIELESAQFRLFPVYIKLLADQAYLPEVLAAFQNSPMTIDVREIRIQRPDQRVSKPEKGQQGMFGGMMGGYGGMMGGYGGMMDDYGGMTMFGGRGGGMMPGMMDGYGGEGGYGMMGGYGGMRGGMTPAKKGVDMKADYAKKVAEKKKQEEDEKLKAKTQTKYEFYDPFYNLVQVELWGQARLYQSPPEPEVVEITAEEVTAGEAMPAEGDAPIEIPATPAEPDAPATEPAKADDPTPPSPVVETPAEAPSTNDQPQPEPCA